MRQMFFEYNIIDSDIFRLRFKKDEMKREFCDIFFVDLRKSLLLGNGQ